MKNEFQWTDELVKEFMLTYNKVDKLITGVDPIIETMQEWKVSHQPKEPEIIYVKVFNEALNDKDQIGYWCSVTRPIPPEKFPAIKQAIEQVLNDDMECAFDEEKILARYQELLKNSPIYTQDQVNKIEEDAFVAGRARVQTPVYVGDTYMSLKYNSFEQYKNKK